MVGYSPLFLRHEPFQTYQIILQAVLNWIYSCHISPYLWGDRELDFGKKTCPMSQVQFRCTHRWTLFLRTLFPPSMLAKYNKVTTILFSIERIILHYDINRCILRRSQRQQANRKKTRWLLCTTHEFQVCFCHHHQTSKPSRLMSGVGNTVWRCWQKHPNHAWIQFRITINSHMACKVLC